jgi:hypothetical protein
MIARTHENHRAAPAPMSVRLRHLALGLLWILPSCGEGVHAPKGATDCDPVEDEGCGRGLHCRLVADGETTCLPPSSRIMGGVACAAATCDPGQACVVVEGHLGCQPVCRIGDDTACGADGRCAYRVGSAEAEFGVCAPRCSLAGRECGAGTTCAPSADLGFPVCVAAGAVGNDEPCDATARCGTDLACLLDENGPRCRVLCDPARLPDPCIVGQCTGRVRPVPEVGFCVGSGA